jgi:hypothetical protein
MAGEWIKMRTDLHEDPRVFAIASALQCPIAMVIGCLHRVWSWADKHTVDGNAPGVTAVTLDSLVGVTGFAEAMALPIVNWLWITSEGISLPDFDVHNGETAKERAQNAKRAAKSRHKKRDDRDARHGDGVTKTAPREEKNRKDKNNTSAHPRAEMDLPDWVPIGPWEAYVEMRAEQRKHITNAGRIAVVAELDKLRAAGNDVGEMLLQSARAGYLDVFPVTKKLEPRGVQVTRWWSTDQGVLDEAARYQIATRGKSTSQLVNEIRAKQGGQP